jgi:hypothetical protein
MGFWCPSHFAHSKTVGFQVAKFIFCAHRQSDNGKSETNNLGVVPAKTPSFVCFFARIYGIVAFGHGQNDSC